jgi:Protein of unknown function (DUF1367)
MTELVLTKTPTGALVPADSTTTEFLAKLRVGAGLKGDFKRQRNPRFHRKAFALFKLAFDMWEAPELEYQGQPVAKDFDQFRKDLTILAGHYSATVNLRGEVRLRAKSLNFANMDDTEFERVYRSILDAVWTRVLASKGYSSAAVVDSIVEELLRFD